jgi:hypothetical protein
VSRPVQVTRVNERERLWLLKKSVIGMSFPPAMVAVAEFFVSTSTKRRIQQWVSVG